MVGPRLSRKFLLPVFLVFGFFVSAAAQAQAQAQAQAPLEPNQLPAKTMFYLIWRGTPAGDVNTKNSLLGLWNDPGFSGVRAAFVEAMLNNSEEKHAASEAKAAAAKNGAATKAEAAAPQMSKEEVRQKLQEYSALLDNAFVIGYIPDPSAKKAPAAASNAPNAKAEAKVSTWNGMFLVYDRTGKEALLSKAVLEMRAKSKDIPKLSELTVAGVPALKITSKDNTTYWAENGKYAVTAGELPVFEEVLARVYGKSAGKSSLAESAAYREAKPLLSGGLVEFFLTLPNLGEMAGDANASGFQVKPMLDALKLDAIHSIAGSLSFDSPKTNFKGAVLGNASSGTLFDIWSAGQENPASLALVPQDVVYYNETQIDGEGIYAVLHRLATALTPPGQTGGVDFLDAMAKSRLGMPAQDALALVTGEFASIQNSPSLADANRAFFLGIRNKPESLKLVRTLLGDQVTSERNEGATTFLKISLKGGESSKGLAQWNFYQLGLTSDYLVGSTKLDTVRDTLARAGKSNPPAELVSARGQFPAKLNGFSYFDFQRLDWQAVKNKWIADAQKSAEKATSAESAAASEKIIRALRDVDPKVFQAHLHRMVGASWKDAKGLHFEQHVE